jgi:hypothetical protein
MRIDLDNLPSEPALLQHLVRDMAAVVEHRDGEIERLKLIIKKLQRAQFGRRSERLDDDQLVLALDDLEGDIGQVEESHPITIAEAAGALPKRKPLPDHLPREEIGSMFQAMLVHAVAGQCIGSARAIPKCWIGCQLGFVGSAPRAPNMHAGSAIKWYRQRRRNAPLLAGSQRRHCSPRCSSANIAITHRSTGSRRSLCKRPNSAHGHAKRTR